jgi:arylsulfatase A-like enzyme
VVLALTLPSCETPRRPNVLWIVWDTVRADHLGLYGYERETTPNLERWAAGARVFEDCLSTAGYTLPSHGSMFTGLLPSEHCAHNDHPRLDDRYPTIAELLRSVGYRTYMYSANPHISSAGNLAQGFDRADHPWSPHFRERAKRIVRDKLSDEDTSSELGATFRRAAPGSDRMSIWNIKATGELAEEAILAWLDSEDARRPFFVFANYMEAHRPLIPPRRYRERMLSPEQVERSYRVNRSWMPTWEYTFGLRDYDDEEIELTRATYDAALAELDELFGHLIETLQERGHLDDTVVILTSDHGEHLGEQHMLDHQHSVYQPLLRVPLIVHYPPRFAPGREATPVANFDVFPTLLELIGIDPPIGLRSRATSLLSPSSERPRYAEDPAAARVSIATVKLSHPDWDPAPWQRRLRTLVEDDHKLIWGSDGRRELFDLSADPLERDDLIERRDDLASTLQQSLDAYHGSLELCEPGEAPPDLTPQQIERLKALGYIGG